MPVLSGTILTVILVVIAVWVIASCIRVVPQAAISTTSAVAIINLNFLIAIWF